MNRKITIKQIFIDNWHKFLALGFPIRAVVLKEVQRIMSCGDPSLGHALYFCSHCWKYKYVPFRCKSRFCNTCGMKYVQDRAHNLTSKLIRCSHRHLVFTIPQELRVFFREDSSLLDILFQAASQTIFAWFYSQNKSQNFTPGFICVLHTFGRGLKWNPHIHMLITEGASGNTTVWRPFIHFPFVMLRKRWQTTLLFLLEQRLGKDKFRRIKNQLYKANKDGFYVYAKSNMAKTKDVVNYVVRYIGRPVMAQSRIINYDGNLVTFWYERHEDGKKVIETITAFEFIKRLIIHIPEEQFKMVRYYGLYAKKHKHQSKLFKMVNENTIKVRKLLSHWRERIQLSFGYDPILCSCGRKMEFIDIFFPSQKSVERPPPKLYNFSA